MEKSPSWSRAHDWKSCNREKRFESSNLSFSAKKTRRFSWVFCCFDREILSHNHYLIARDGYAAELSVARSTMRVNSPVLAVRRISLSPPKKPDVSVGFFAVQREILCNQNMIARGCAAELSVARSTMRVNSPVLAVRRISLSPKPAEQKRCLLQGNN